MTTNQLKNASIELLAAFNDEGLEITEDTILSSVISNSDQMPGVSSATMFKALIIWTIHHNNKPKKIKFPENWLSLTVAEFSAELLKK